MKQKVNPETNPHLNQNRIYNKSGIANQRGYPYRKNEYGFPPHTIHES